VSTTAPTGNVLLCAQHCCLAAGALVVCLSDVLQCGAFVLLSGVPLPARHCDVCANMCVLPAPAVLCRAKRRRVNDAYVGTLSSYAYVLMCISHLQVSTLLLLTSVAWGSQDSTHATTVATVWLAVAA
jgi:hypothetical protein